MVPPACFLRRSLQIITSYTAIGKAGFHTCRLKLSPQTYNDKVGLALFCPVTSQVKSYPFEVVIPAGLNVSGVILADQVRSFDWRARQAEFICQASEIVLAEVLQKLNALLR